ncbi:MAG: adenine phosphoribosyltransferase, partial [Candidatus Omnitrophica bacterium]|nr:adenine phosphoribosyltransferase [Candidatus Omnitrophota bacterium]
FKDITTLLQDKEALKVAIDALAEKYEGQAIDAVIGVEARGFIFGTALAYKLGTGFIPVRKKGKLPYKTKKVTYDLEYGTDTLEMHEDAVSKDSKVLIVDDLLATGGTVGAVAKLVQEQGADIVGLAFLVELGFLNGREKLGDIPVHSVIKY